MSVTLYSWKSKTYNVIVMYLFCNYFIYPLFNQVSPIEIEISVSRELRTKSKQQQANKNTSVHQGVTKAQL